MSSKKCITLPLKKADITALKAGDQVVLSGNMLVGRDQVHERLAGLINACLPLPVMLSGETIYYMGPTPDPPGRIIGSCGPTTSARMDLYTPLLMEHGIICTIGKGPRSGSIIDAIRKYGGLYLYAFGGCGALYAQTVVSKTVLAFEDLGPEALLRIHVSGFPAVVAIDSKGKNLY